MKKLSILTVSLALFGCGDDYNASQNNDSSTQTVETNVRTLNLKTFSQSEVCQYNFDATQEDYDVLWNNQNPEYLIGSFPSIDGQKFNFAVTPPYFSDNDPEYGSVNYLQYLASSKSRLYAAKDFFDFPSLQNSLGDFILPITGILAFEMQLDIPDSPLNGSYYEDPASSYITDINFSGVTSSGDMVNALYSYGAGTADPDFGENPPYVLYTVNYQNNNGEHNSVAYYYNQMDGYQNKVHRLGIYINQNTKQVGFIVNGVDHGYQGELPAALQNIGFDIFNRTSSDQNGLFSNKLSMLNFSSELITDRGSLQFNYPQGTTDICGNTI